MTKLRCGPLLWLALALGCVWTDRQAERAETGLFDGARLNILLIVADDLGYTDLGAYGSEISGETTPLADSRPALAAELIAAWQDSRVGR